jgi:hypothetical protein
MIAGATGHLWKIEEIVGLLGSGMMCLMPEITISLDDDLMAELAQMAHDEHTTEADLVREGVERLLHSRLTGPDVPRFARRLGPLAIPERHVEP